MWVALAAWVACTPDTVGPGVATAEGTGAAHPPGPDLLGPQLLGQVEVRPAADPALQLVWELELTADEPCTLELIVDDGHGARRIRFAAEDTHHRVPLLGLHGDSDVAVVPFLIADGVTELEPVDFQTQPATLELDLQVLTDAGTSEPGWTLIPGHVDTESVGVVVVVDSAGNPVWIWDPTAPMLGAKLVGTELWSIRLHRITRFAVDGSSIAMYSESTGDFGEIPTGVKFHHDVVPTATGTMLALSTEVVPVGAYPRSVRAPTLLEPAPITADRVVELANDGAVLDEWRLEELLDTSRVGYHATGDGNDWSHANAVVEVPEREAFVVSLRHQDAVVEIGRDGTVHWILANPDGWSAPFADLLLTPIGDAFGWPYHQHAPELGVHDDGRISVLLLDNGNEGRTTPYSRAPHPDGDFSRAVQYAIDPDAGTVEQLWALRGDGRGSDLYSRVMGDADRLPTTGHVLVTYAAMKAEGGVLNAQIGLGAESIRAIEVNPETGEVVWDLRITVDGAVRSDGWRADRIQRIPSLYGPSLATEEWL